MAIEIIIRGGGGGGGNLAAQDDGTITDDSGATVATFNSREAAIAYLQHWNPVAALGSFPAEAEDDRS